MNNKNYKIICEEIEQNNIILEDVISEGLIDSLKNMGKSALSGVANAANAMTEKFISGIASLFGKPKKDGSINKIDADSLAQKLSSNSIIKKLFGDKINDIINGCKSISKEDLMSVMDDKKVESEVEKLPEKDGKQPTTESVFYNLDKLFIICEAAEEQPMDISKYEVEIVPGDENPVKIKDKSGKEVTDKTVIQHITKSLLDKSSNNDTKPAEIKDANEEHTEAGAGSSAAAQWVIDRGAKVLDIIQFPYNKEKLKEYIAKKIDSFSIVKDGKLKSKMGILGAICKWIGLIVLIFMIAHYAALGGVVAVGGYMAAKMGRKALSKIAMYGGKKYAEGVVGKADKANKARL